MSIDSGVVADRQRSRAFRRSTQGRGAAARAPEPPRQRRPALAALALLLIVGGALGAGLLAIRMDSRVPVLAANRDIAPGQLLTADDVRLEPVASEGLNLIPEHLADQVLDGATYAKVPIEADTLLDGTMLTVEDPVGEDRAMVSVPLLPALTPADELQGGDVVEVFRVSGGQGNGQPSPISEALVVRVVQGVSDDLGGTQSGSALLVVPAGAAAAVVDAAGANLAGLALVRRGQPADVDLRVTGR